MRTLLLCLTLILSTFLQAQSATKPGQRVQVADLSLAIPGKDSTATVAPDALDGEPVDVVSIHLDFLADRVRRRQVEQLVERFRGHDGHLVVMGDFNCAWSERRRSLDLLLHELKLRPCRDSAAATYPAWRPLVRLDWILVSEGLEFSAYDTLDDRVSDHLGVVAEVHRRKSALHPRERTKVQARRLPSVSLA